MEKTPNGDNRDEKRDGATPPFGDPPKPEAPSGESLDAREPRDEVDEARGGHDTGIEPYDVRVGREEPEESDEEDYEYDDLDGESDEDDYEYDDLDDEFDEEYEDEYDGEWDDFDEEEFEKSLPYDKDWDSAALNGGTRPSGKRLGVRILAVVLLLSFSLNIWLMEELLKQVPIPKMGGTFVRDAAATYDGQERMLVCTEDQRYQLFVNRQLSDRGGWKMGYDYVVNERVELDRPARLYLFTSDNGKQFQVFLIGRWAVVDDRGSIVLYWKKSDKPYKNPSELDNQPAEVKGSEM